MSTAQARRWCHRLVVPPAAGEGVCTVVLRVGDRVRVRAVDEQDRLSGLSERAEGVVRVHLAVGGYLVTFAVFGAGVFSAEELVRVDGQDPVPEPGLGAR